MKLGEIIQRYNSLKLISDTELDFAIESLTKIADGLDELGVQHSLSSNEVRRLLRSLEAVVERRAEHY